MPPIKIVKYDPEFIYVSKFTGVLSSCGILMEQMLTRFLEGGK